MSAQQQILRKETELRCEIPENATLSVKLIAGSAELFGVELAMNKEYTFRDQNIAIFTWYGCTLEVVAGEGCSLYDSDSTPMVAYVNTHVQLEARRDVALANKDNGPRVLIVGPAEHGKSSLAQILAAYAVRLDRTPILIDLDSEQGAFCVPGCITAVPLDKPTLNVETGFKNVTPLVYFHGHNQPKDNIEYYKLLITNLAAKINARLALDEDARASGIVVNTSAYSDGEGLSLIQHTVAALGIDVVLVMSHDKLYSTLSATLKSTQPPVTVVKLPKSGGVVTKDANTRKRLRKNLVREYFYGRVTSLTGQPSTTQFSPERRESVPLSAFTFLRVGGVQISEGMKAFGTKEDPLKLTRITPTKELAFCVVAVLHMGDSAVTAGSASIPPGGEVPQSLLQCNVAGFVSIVQVDTERGVMTLLCPCPGALPSSFLLVGSVKWME